jgi:hypothetical protein
MLHPIMNHRVSIMKLVKYPHHDVSQGLWCAALGGAAGNLPLLKERLWNQFSLKLQSNLGVNCSRFPECSNFGFGKVFDTEALCDNLHLAGDGKQDKNLHCYGVCKRWRAVWQNCEPASSFDYPFLLICE